MRRTLFAMLVSFALVCGLTLLSWGPSVEAQVSGPRLPTGCANTDLARFNSSTGRWVCVAASGVGAPTAAQYWVGAADGGLSAEKDLSGFTGLVLNTAGTPTAAAANTCTTQFARSATASGVWTCATVGTADISAALATLGIVSAAVGSNTTAVNNLTGDEDVIYNVTVPAATLDTNTQALVVTTGGTQGTISGTQQIRIRTIEGANNTVVFDSGTDSNQSPVDWTLSCTIIRVSTTTAKAACWYAANGAVISIADSTTTFTYTWANAGTVRLSGEGTNTGDVVGEFIKVVKQP